MSRRVHPGPPQKGACRSRGKVGTMLNFLPQGATNRERTKRRPRTPGASHAHWQGSELP